MINQVGLKLIKTATAIFLPVFKISACHYFKGKCFNCQVFSKANHFNYDCVINSERAHEYKLLGVQKTKINVGIKQDRRRLQDQKRLC